MHWDPAEPSIRPEVGQATAAPAARPCQPCRQSQTCLLRPLAFPPSGAPRQWMLSGPNTSWFLAWGAGKGHTAAARHLTRCPGPGPVGPYAYTLGAAACRRGRAANPTQSGASTGGAPRSSSARSGPRRPPPRPCHTAPRPLRRPLRSPSRPPCRRASHPGSVAQQGYCCCCHCRLPAEPPLGTGRAAAGPRELESAAALPRRQVPTGRP